MLFILTIIVVVRAVMTKPSTMHVKRMHTGGITMVFVEIIMTIELLMCGEPRLITQAQTVYGGPTARTEAALPH